MTSFRFKSILTAATLALALIAQGCSSDKDGLHQTTYGQRARDVGTEVGNDEITPTEDEGLTTIRPTESEEHSGVSATGGSLEGTEPTGTTGDIGGSTGGVLATPPTNPLSDFADRYGSVVPSTVPADGLLAPNLGGSTIQIPVVIDPSLIHGAEGARFPGVILDPRLLASKVQVLTRDDQGSLHVCEGSSAATKWENSARCFDIPSAGHDGEYVVGQPAAVYQTGAYGTALHILARTNRGGMTWTVCRADDLTQCRTYLPFYGNDNIRENPSLVALSDGTVYGFFRNHFDQLGYIRLQALDRFALDYPYLTLGDEISGSNATILDADTRAGCGSVWNSPSAAVVTNAEGGEDIVVMARDNDLLRGSLRIARLNHANDSDASRRTWQCQTSSFAGMTLGSTPAAFANRWNNTLDVFGKTQPDVLGNGHYLAHWRGLSGNSSPVGISSFEEKGSIARDQMSYPWSQSLSLAVHGNGEVGGSIHLFYRTANGHLGHSFNADPTRSGDFASELVSDTNGGVVSLPAQLANSTPSAVVDPRGVLHVFARPQGAGLLHFFKTADSDWQGESLTIPVGTGESSPVTLMVP